MRTQLTSIPLALLAGALLTACGGGGGGGGGGSADIDAVPAYATTTPEAFTTFTTSLPEEERIEPLTLDDIVPPTSETAEPAVLTR